MFRTWTTITLLAALAVAVLLPAGSARASNAIAAKTGLVCTTCHDKPGSKLLTDRGKYYELMGNLEGFDEINEAFGKCTTCHVKKPGSTKLTAEGKRLARAIENMDALRALVLAKHPNPPASEGPGEGGDAMESHAGMPRTAPADAHLMPAH
jgi:hypothetical protein